MWHYNRPTGHAKSLRSTIVSTERRGGGIVKPCKRVRLPGWSERSDMAQAGYDHSIGIVKSITKSACEARFTQNGNPVTQGGELQPSERSGC